MRQTKVFCDGCKNEIGFGFEMAMLGEQARGISAYLERPAHFCSLACLALWVKKAVLAAERLQKQARLLNPHGTFHDEDVSALAVS